MDFYDRVYATIDPDTAKSNMRAVRGSLPPTTSIIGVVKTDGYGHGTVPAVRAIDPHVEGCAVAAIDEMAIPCRHGIQKMILVLGVTHENRLGDLVWYDIRPAMSRYEEARKLSEVATESGARASIHLVVDTGMSRIGVTPDEVSTDEAAGITRPPGIRIKDMFTHFARVNEVDKKFYGAQYKKYRGFCEMLHGKGMDIPIRCCSNSAGIMEGLDSNRLDMVCARISIYSLYPSDGVVRDKVKLVPIMELKNIVIYIKTTEPGTSASYSDTPVVDRPTCVATIPVGYRDGYPRNLSNKGVVLMRGKRTGILGRICMDQSMTDIMDTPEAAEGDQVTLIGEGGREYIAAEELARVGGDFHYEIICGIGKRTPRAYLRDGGTIG